jgi:hypothetical protein
MGSAQIDGPLVNTTQPLYGALGANTGLEKPPATHEPPSLLDGKEAKRGLEARSLPQPPIMQVCAHVSNNPDSLTLLGASRSPV